MSTQNGAQESQTAPRWSEQERLALAAQVRPAREAKDWTQAELARHAGVHRNTVVNMEKGTVPQAANLQSVLEALGMDRPSAAWSEETELWLGMLAPLIESLPDEIRERVMLGVYRRLHEASHPVTLGTDEGRAVPAPAE